MNLKKVSALVMCVAVTGCAGGKVLFNKDDPRSGFTKTKDITLKLDQNINTCGVVNFSADIINSGTQNYVPGVDVALALGTFGYGLAKTEVNNYIASKITKYSFEYNKLISYYDKNEKTDLKQQEMCFVFQRTVSVTNEADAKSALSFTIGYKRFGESDAFIVILSNIKLTRSGALTTNNDGINLFVSTTMTTLPKEPYPTGVINTSNFTIQNVPFLAENGNADPKPYVGPIFKIIPYGTPISLSISVTEKGNGVENLTTLQEDIKNNSDSAKALLDLAIKKHYEE